MTQTTFNGNSYSDDGSQPRDMRNGGWRNWLLPMMADAAVEIDQAKAAQTYAADAAASAVAAANYGAALQGTSTTSLTVAAGAQLLTTQPGKQFTPGQYVILSRQSAPSTYMWGTITSYNSGSGALAVNAVATAGSGTAADWQISLSGAQGPQGPAARAYVRSKSASYTAVLADIGCIIDCTGSWTLSLTAAAVLGDGYYVWVRNAGSGTITIDPAGAETIDGGATTTLPAGHYCLLQCDGGAWKTTQLGVVGLQKLSIFSAATAGKTPVSSLEMLGDGANYIGAMGTATAVYWVAQKSLFVLLTTTAPYIYTSPDGKIWTARNNTLGGSAGLRMASNGSVWIVSNTTNATWTQSTDLISWTACTGPASSHGVYSAGSAFMSRASSGSNGAYYSSPDGSAWTQRYTMGSSMTGVVGLGTTRVVANTQLAMAHYSTDSGATWTAAATPPAAALYALAAGGGRVVGIHFSAANTRYSTDGNTWSNGGALPTSANVAIAYGAGLFVVVGNAGAIATSPDSTTWTSRTSGVSANLTHVIFTGTKFVAVGQASGTIPVVLTSPDGITWTLRTSGLPTDSSSARWAAYMGTTYVISTDTVVYTSSDAITWATAGAVTLANTAYQRVCAVGSTLYCTAGNSPVYSSTDGVNWAALPGVAKGSTISAYGSELYVSQYGLAKSTDSGATWTPVARSIDSLLPSGWRVGSVGLIIDDNSNWYATTTDGVTWTQRTLPSPYGYNAAQAFVDGRLYLRQTSGGSVVSTADGINWTTEASAWQRGSAVSGAVAKFRNCWISGNSSYTYTQGALTDPPGTRQPVLTFAGTGVAASSSVLVMAASTTLNVLDATTDPKGLFAS